MESTSAWVRFHPFESTRTRFRPEARQEEPAPKRGARFFLCSSPTRSRVRRDAIEVLRQPLCPGLVPLADALADEVLSQVIRIGSGKSIIPVMAESRSGRISRLVEKHATPLARRAARVPNDWLSGSGVAIWEGEMHDPSYVVGAGFTRAPVALALRPINLTPVAVEARIEDDAEGVR